MGDDTGALTESQRFQVQEARDILETWDLARAGVVYLDRETVLADQVRALLAITDHLAAALDAVLEAHRNADGRCAWCRNQDGQRQKWPCGEYQAIARELLGEEDDGR